MRKSFFFAEKAEKQEICLDPFCIGDADLASTLADFDYFYTGYSF